MWKTFLGLILHPTQQAKPRSGDERVGVRHTVIWGGGGGGGGEGEGEEHSEEKREQASTSCYYIFQFQTAVEQNSQLVWNTTGIIARAV